MSSTGTHTLATPLAIVSSPLVRSGCVPPMPMDRPGQPRDEEGRLGTSRREDDDGRPHLGVPHPCPARRRSARPDHGRPGSADLPDHVVRVRVGGRRGQPLRAAEVRERLQPDRPPDGRGPGGADRLARGRPRRCGSLFPSGPGDHIGSAASLYGWPITQLDVTLRRFGVQTTFVRGNDPADYAAAITDRTKLVFAEVVANPGSDVADIAGLAEVAHAAGVPLVVD